MIEKELRFKTLVRENEEKIRRICRYYAPKEEEQNDMYQEILVNIWKSLDSFRGDSAIGTWVYRVAVNTSLNYSGQYYKRMKLNVEAGSEWLQNAFSREDDYMLKEERIEALQAELNQLSFVDKAIMGLVMEGLSTKDISDIIGITESNVRVKIHRIKHALRQKLSNYTETH
ncbi:MAG: RNA polymerase sigma factor [bacterium]